MIDPADGQYEVEPLPNTDLTAARERLSHAADGMGTLDLGPGGASVPGSVRWQLAADIRLVLHALDASEKKLALALAMFPKDDPNVSFGGDEGEDALTPEEAGFVRLAIGTYQRLGNKDTPRSLADKLRRIASRTSTDGAGKTGEKK